MKIDADFSVDGNVNSTQITSFNDFLNTFATINYKLGSGWMSKRINTQSIKPKVSNNSSHYYIEVPNDVKNASEIYLSFNVRNQVYNYVLK